MKNTILKLNSIVDSALKTHQKGDKFFVKIDDALKRPENQDIIHKLFEQVYSEFGYEYNLVLSGSFSNYILYLIRHDHIICKGNILQVSGHLTSHQGEIGKITKNKEVEVASQRSDFSNQDFIFVDDSYFSGTTEMAINEFLKKFNSKVIKTYVIYDGNFHSKGEVSHIVSLYNYFEHHHGVEKPVEVLLEYLYKMKDIPYDIYQQKIISGEITTLYDLKNQINQFHSKVGDHQTTINPFQHDLKLESIKIKRYSEFNSF